VGAGARGGAHLWARSIYRRLMTRTRRATCSRTTRRTWCRGCASGACCRRVVQALRAGQRADAQQRRPERRPPARPRGGARGHAADGAYQPVRRDLRVRDPVVDGLGHAAVRADALWQRHGDHLAPVKLDAMRVYDREQPPFPHPRSERALQALAALRGVQCGEHGGRGVRARPSGSTSRESMLLAEAQASFDTGLGARLYAWRNDIGTRTNFFSQRGRRPQGSHRVVASRSWPTERRRGSTSLEDGLASVPSAWSASIGCAHGDVECSFIVDPAPSRQADTVRGWCPGCAIRGTHWRRSASAGGCRCAPTCQALATTRPSGRVRGRRLPARRVHGRWLEHGRGCECARRRLPPTMNRV
jgi:hypothetical protein